MQKLTRILGICLIVGVISCQVDIRPTPHPKSKQMSHQECLEKCKGLKGHDRAECNKECNRKYR